MCHPGEIQTLPNPHAEDQPPHPLLQVAGAILDHEVTHYVIDGVQENSMLEQGIQHDTKSLCGLPEQADFIFIPDGNSNGHILKARRGSPEYPDTSATIVYGVRSLTAHTDGQPLGYMKGPGIRERVALPPITGLDRAEILQLIEVNKNYPLGVDAIFVDKKGKVLAIPRSTSIEMTE
jgi:alpha-D-ribose 1-methylphosphonate 5-triphosphate synthase subunit PhnH